MMDRRRALMMAKPKSKKIYIFKDGQYQSWLNGREFAFGGYQKREDGTGDSQPEYSLTISDGKIVFSMTGTGNRTNHESIGIKVSDLLPGPVKKIGGYFTCTTYENSASQTEEFGVSEKFVTSTTESTAFGEHQLSHIAQAGNKEVDITINAPNYVVFHLMRKNVKTRSITISELWVEV